MGASRRPAVPPTAESASRIPPGRALPGATVSEDASGFGRAMSVIRMALPMVQRLLPLLDNNIATVLANLLTPHPRPQVQAPPPKVDLTPLGDGLAELQTQHRALRDQVAEQNNSMKRVEDQLEMVREATDRNTLEQQELLEDLKTFRKSVKVIAFVTLGLIVIVFFLNLILFLHMQRVLP
jgi:hypothetical protein